MHTPLKIGEPTTIIHPATGEPVTVRVTAIENGTAEITAVAPPDVPLTKISELQPMFPNRV